MDLTFKISGVTRDLGTISRLNYKLITQKDVENPFDEGEGSISIKTYGSYIQYVIEGAYISTTFNDIKTFYNAIKNAEANNSQCTIQTDFEDSSVFCYVYSFDFIIQKAELTKLYYNLVINAGTPIGV